MPTDENDGEVSSPGKGEDWDKWLIEETERFESEKRQLEADVSRMKRENAHLKGELARLRAIENRVPIVRSGNTGISGIIMSNGVVKKRIPLGEQAVFKEKIILGESGSFYTKYGDVFASLCFVILLFINPVLLCLKK